MANHESEAARARRRTRQDARDNLGDLTAYADENGEATAWTGDEDAPYVHALARVANADGTSPVVSQPGEAQRILSDDQGRLFVVVDSDTPLPVEPVPLTIARSTALENSLIAKGSPGAVSEIRMLVTTGIAAARYLMIFDAVGAPALNAVPVWRALLPAPGGTVAEVADSFEGPLTCSVGIVVAISTTPITYTAPSTPEALFSVGYT